LGEEGLVITQIPVKGPLNLHTTLFCGQAFRWKQGEDLGVFAPNLRGKLAFPGSALPFYRGTVENLGIVVLGLERDSQAAGYDDSLMTPGCAPNRIGGDSCAPRSTPKDRCLKVVLEKARNEKSHRDDTRAFQTKISSYFALDDDLETIERELGLNDPVMRTALEFGKGLRILRQDPWECLASYVLSVHNNVKNISAITEYLSRTLGEPVGLGEYAFPSPEVILAQDRVALKASKCGFRLRYLLDAAEKVAENAIDLKAIGSLPLGEARRELMRIIGVGPKVADCVLLFAYHKLAVFPVDVWVARAVSEFYLGGRSVSPEEARREGERRFGPLAGYAQEYLYNYIRNCGPVKLPTRGSA